MRYLILAALLSCAAMQAHALSITVDGTTATADPHHAVSVPVAGHPGMSINITPVQTPAKPAIIPPTYAQTPAVVKAPWRMDFDSHFASIAPGIFPAVRFEPFKWNDSSIIFTSIWTGNYLNQQAIVAAGYLANNPAQGAVFTMLPDAGSGHVMLSPPAIILSADASGPLTIKSLDLFKHQLRMESVSGQYDAVPPAAAKVTVPGNQKYLFDLATRKFE